MTDEIKNGSMEDVLVIISCEGFDYAFHEYTSFKDVQDEEFHILREAFCVAQKAMITYLEQFGEVDV